jgi:hypothetical protein
VLHVNDYKGGTPFDKLHVVPLVDLDGAGAGVLLDPEPENTASSGGRRARR